MAHAPRALPDFLAWAKAGALAHLHGAARAPRLVLVMGNEAGDLDSAACAIAVAYLLTHDAAFAASHGFRTDAIYAPLLQTPRAGLRQRRENLMTYEALGLALDALLCVDDLGVARDAPLRDVSLGIVDHASLVPAWGAARTVDLVVDHHEDDGAHRDARLRIVRAPSTDPVGSCASIVAQLYAAAQRASGAPLERAVADLLLSALLLDTKNVRRRLTQVRMAPSGKATATDAEAYAFLVPRSSFAQGTPRAFLDAAQRFGGEGDAEADEVGVSPAQAHTRAWADALGSVKADVAHLRTPELLARDLKIAAVPVRGAELLLGLASVPVSVSAWWHAWWADVRRFVDARRLDALVILAAYRTGEKRKKRRDLVLVYAADAPAFADVVARLEAHDAPSLVLGAYAGERRIDGAVERARGVGADGALGGVRAALFAQGNTKANRKVVQPVLVDVLQRS
ncbi:exopolyphosphatase [Malassezia obtusa]|uniref:Exopolyphosphatase n=1 Tax=Malassezia obtusa TaxID=76774 RepID=A0AAF0IUI2_9BASI|nr:exopolyphosphatase [Malassezia obtusa]